MRDTTQHSNMRIVANCMRLYDTRRQGQGRDIPLYNGMEAGKNKRDEALQDPGSRLTCAGLVSTRYRGRPGFVVPRGINDPWEEAR